MIKMQVIGHLGHDARVKVTDAGSVANFGVAHTERYKDGLGVFKERTTWVDCSLWDREALHPYLKTGQLVFLEGYPGANVYEKDGKATGKLKLTVFNIQLLARPRNSTASTPAAAGPGTTEQQSTSVYSGDDPTDDLPF